ncbi:MAG: leucyl/phenylalanyl-tRNA--protein transferase [Proteobacteria bacterium]|nr:leucyl/phenylalanyl-tRNA--protein transferase [Pseudomonadota bacterium]
MFPDPRTLPGDEPFAYGVNYESHVLIDAYAHGIFPWPYDNGEVYWWSPDPRAVLFPSELHVSRSLRRTLNRGHFRFSVDRDFRGVIAACARTPRNDQGGTWITDDMLAAYLDLHNAGYAHSLETWQDGKLVGGIYGVALGKVFFGESMFSHASDASKAALVMLVDEMRARDFVLLDCQVASAHLESLGSREISRHSFLELLEAHAQSNEAGYWEFHGDPMRALDAGRKVGA